MSNRVYASSVFSCSVPAMQRKPLVSEVRTPTDTWSGLGFSKSMPAEAVKELRSISRRSYKPYLSTISSQQQQVQRINKNISQAQDRMKNKKMANLELVEFWNSSIWSIGLFYYFTSWSIDPTAAEMVE